MFQSCRHILEGNHQCGSPALKGQRYCRHHRGIHDYQGRSGLRSRIRPQAAGQTAGPIPTQSYDHGTVLVPESRVAPQTHHPLQLLYPEDRASIQANIYFIADYLARGLMDRSNATALMYAMQVAQTNLGKRPLLEPLAAPTPNHSQSRPNTDTDSDSETTYDPGCPTSGGSDVGLRPVHRVILTPEGDEIAPPLEILEDNEAEPVHHKGCPCMTCAEKYRNHAPEEHHALCQCGLCEEQEPEQFTEHSAQSSAHPNNDVILSEVWREAPNVVEGPAFEDRDQRSPESKDLLLAETNTTKGAPSFRAFSERVGSGSSEQPTLGPELCALNPPRPRIARASALLSGNSSRDPLNRPWSVAEYTFGDAIRRHEAQYAARAAACLAAGIEPPPYQPYTTGLIPPGHPDYEEEQKMQQHSSEYWAAHFRKQIADPKSRTGLRPCGGERPDLEQEVAQEEQAGSAGEAP